MFQSQTHFLLQTPLLVQPDVHLRFKEPVDAPSFRFCAIEGSIRAVHQNFHGRPITWKDGNTNAEAYMDLVSHILELARSFLKEFLGKTARRLRLKR